MRIEGSTALVTGANRGLGRRFAEELLARGATVYAGARDPGSVDLPGVTRSRWTSRMPPRRLHGYRHGAPRDRTEVRPAVVAKLALDGLEAGQPEVLADDVSRGVLGKLSGGVTALYPQFA